MVGREFGDDIGRVVGADLLLFYIDTCHASTIRLPIDELSARLLLRETQLPEYLSGWDVVFLDPAEHVQGRIPAIVSHKS